MSQTSPDAVSPQLSDTPTAPADAVASSDSADGMVEFLGLIACCALSSLDQYANEAKTAPSVLDKLTLARLAAGRFSHVSAIEDLLHRQDADLDAAIAPFAAPVGEFHEATKPTTWAETLLKTHLVGGLARDFAAQVRPYLPVEVARILSGSIDDVDLESYAADRLADVLEAQPELVGRMSLFGRRIVGEAIVQAQRVAAKHDVMTSWVTGSPSEPGHDLAVVSQIMGDLADAHGRRMDDLRLFG